MGFIRKVSLDIANPNTWPTRAEVAKLLKCSAMTIRRMDHRRLHPFVDKQGVHRYNPIEVRGVEVRDARRGKHHVPTQGELEAAVVDLLVQGKTKLDIVRQLAMPLDEVQRIWEKAQQSFEDAAEAKQKADVRARHDARQRHAAELASRERIEKLRIEKERARSDAQAQKDLARMLRKSLGKITRERKVESESPDEDEAGAAAGAEE